MAKIGLSHKEIKLILEDALRHSESMSKSELIEAITSAIVENNKRIETTISDFLGEELTEQINTSVNGKYDL